MFTLTEINRQLDDLRGLSSLVGVYGQSASTKMRRIRQAVLSNRDYLESINVVFNEVLYFYKTKKDKKAYTFLSHNGKTVVVFLSANTGLYGDIVQRTFEFFKGDIKDKDVEITIVGKLGLSIFLGSGIGKPYSYFDMSDYQIKQEDLTALIRHLVQYDKIILYFGRYKSVVSQSPDKFVISSDFADTEGSPVHLNNYIFEPDVEKILAFFEKEIFASLFDHELRESQLAKFASRILAMDLAETNIKKRMGETATTRLKLIHRIANQKQINALAPMLISMRGNL